MNAAARMRIRYSRAVSSSRNIESGDRSRARPRIRESLSGWGKSPAVASLVRRHEKLEVASHGAVLSRGLGRSYGDAALPPVGCDRPVAISVLADRVLSFDQNTGSVRAEAGISVGELRRIFLPRGYFLPVTPGTQHVTLGGLVAADVHGKNHHVAGSFGGHVDAILIRVGDGRILEATRHENVDLFDATIGGMGLTGHILEVAFKLERVPSSWIYEESERCSNLEELMQTLHRDSKSWPMTVAWMDTSARGDALGRGIVMRGRWAESHEAPRRSAPVRRAVSLPFELPSGLINPTTIAWLNRAWFAKHGPKRKSRIVDPESFFWPLDRIAHWNRAFGRRGFTQYQCVMPESTAGYRRLLSEFQARGGCSFVSVFKDCGPRSAGIMSFPQPGTSLALDIPLRGAATQSLVDALNDIVIENGGRIYLAKDGLTRPQTFARMYDRIEEFQAIRRRYDPDALIVSHQSQRIFGDQNPAHIRLEPRPSVQESPQATMSIPSPPAFQQKRSLPRP